MDAILFLWGWQVKTAQQLCNVDRGQLVWQTLDQVGQVQFQCESFFILSEMFETISPLILDLKNFNILKTNRQKLFILNFLHSRKKFNINKEEVLWLFWYLFGTSMGSKMEISQLILRAQKTFTTHFSFPRHSKMVQQFSIQDSFLSMS